MGQFVAVAGRLVEHKDLYHDMVSEGVPRPLDRNLVVMLVYLSKSGAASRRRTALDRGGYTSIRLSGGPEVSGMVQDHFR